MRYIHAPPILPILIIISFDSLGRSTSIGNMGEARTSPWELRTIVDIILTGLLEGITLFLPIYMGENK